MADTAESSKRLTYEDITRLHERQEEIKRANSQYLGEHPELKNLVADFTAAILMQKPDDVFKFARDHFSVYLKDQESKDATAIYYGKHVIGDRRYELVITNSTDRSHWLQLSAKDISPHHPPLNAVFSASEVLSNFGLEDADPSEAAIKVSRCLKPKDGKLILTSDHGASPTVEEFDASVRIQAIARAKKQRQEVQELKEQTKAAIKIQSIQRQRQHATRVDELKQTNRAATKIQAVYRGNAARES